MTAGHLNQGQGRMRLNRLHHHEVSLAPGIGPWQQMARCPLLSPRPNRFLSQINHGRMSVRCFPAHTYSMYWSPKENVSNKVYFKNCHLLSYTDCIIRLIKKCFLLFPRRFHKARFSIQGIPDLNEGSVLMGTREPGLNADWQHSLLAIWSSILYFFSLSF